MERLKMPEGEAIEHTWVTRAIENAQRKVEGRNFDIRKQLLEYDDVANDQRKVIYQQRNDILDTRMCRTWWPICARRRWARCLICICRRARLKNNGTPPAWKKRWKPNTSCKRRSASG